MTTMSPRFFGWFKNKTTFDTNVDKTIQAIRVTARNSKDETRRVICEIRSGGVGCREVSMSISGSGMRSDWQYTVEIYVQEWAGGFQTLYLSLFIPTSPERVLIIYLKNSFLFHDFTAVWDVTNSLSWKRGFEKSPYYYLFMCMYLYGWIVSKKRCLLNGSNVQVL